ncbi:MAG TPA: thiamine ABC transporter substrate-binding protein, partial [Acidimicrobiaceae bacterium]|nr:thiamine ABC transporter substrate-binding protein [Acidimicrobiaceae bacterium]HCB37966.1 thiamine ABC transporter substrate-binding protein [Acidimicrobiaceae bacterium]
ADTGTAGAGTTITLLTHDSFSLSPATLAGFTAETGIVVEQLAVGDAGTLVAQAVLTKDDPLGDVLFGIDSTFLQRGLDAGIFEPYRPPALDDIADGLRADLGLDPEHRVTPVDYGDVCVNYWIAGVATPPTSLDDLVKPEYAGQLVVQHPETSSPGLAFLLATIAAYGDGWEDYWTALRANGVAVAAGWEDAYYGDFAAGGGPRSLVVSYASSPTAEVMFADPPVVSAPTGVVVDSCFRQVEYAGVLAGTDNPAAARRLIDFMLSPAWQDDVPLNMFVYPVVASTALPAVFVRHTAVPDDPLTLAPAEIEAGRDAWTQRWVEIVLR